MKSQLQQKEEENAAETPARNTRGNCNKFEESSDRELCSCAACLPTILMITIDVLSNYECKKIHPAEIFDILACRCQYDR
jgi:hypothetical protein